MSPSNIRFYVRRLYRASNRKHYFIIELPGAGELMIPESRIQELPHDLRRRFLRQREMSLSMIMPALNSWMREEDEKAKDKDT